MLALVGCKDLKSQQLGGYVGDSKTKVLYKNVGNNTTVVPEANRVFFNSVEEAQGEGYVLVNEGADAKGGGAEEEG